MDTIFTYLKKNNTSLINYYLKYWQNKPKQSDKYVFLLNLSIYYTWKDIKKSYKNNKFKISVLTWNVNFELPDGSYSLSDIKDYFEYILKKTWIKEC